MRSLSGKSGVTHRKLVPYTFHGSNVANTITPSVLIGTLSNYILINQIALMQLGIKHKTKEKTQRTSVRSYYHKEPHSSTLMFFWCFC